MAIFGKEAQGRSEPRGASAADVPLSIIANGMRIVGDIETSGVVKVDGRVDGSVNGARQVLLGRGASIRGSIVADEVVVGGVVEGGIVASERLELQGSAVVHGDIETKSIVVLEGARINGSVVMRDAATQSGEEHRGKTPTEPLRIVGGSVQH
jgi:cytoskeletal protein CcmA (bactofilin family)